MEDEKLSLPAASEHEVDETFLALKVVKQGEMVDEMELEKRQRKAAAGKVLVNGVMRHPHDTYRP